MSVQTDSPLAIELFAGTGSGTAGWVESGGLAACFDLEYLSHHGDAPAGSMRVIQDVTTLHGSQFKDATWIWASPPCQKYSYLAMPWSRSTDPENSKAAKALRKKWETEGPDNRLFDACFRIQREAIEATESVCYSCCGNGIIITTAGLRDCASCHGKGKHSRYIPLIVENVRGAVPWVGKQQAQFGSFYLWGDVAQIGTRVVAGRDLADIRAGRGRFGMGVAPERFDQKLPGNNGPRMWKDREIARLNESDGHEKYGGTKGTKPYPNRGWTAGTAISLGLENYNGVKVSGQIQGKEYAMCRTGAAGQKTLGHVNKRDGHGHTRHLTNQGESDAVREAKSGKAAGGWFNDYKKDGEGCVGISRTGSKSNARKAASELIAKIPYALSRYIAEQHYPAELSKTARTG